MQTIFKNALINCYYLIKSNLLLFSIICFVQLFSCSENNNKEYHSDNYPSIEAGQETIFKLWKYEDELASIPQKEISTYKKSELIRELQNISFDDYNSKHQNSFQNYRNKVINVASYEGVEYGYNVGKMRMAKNAVIADWALDIYSATDFNNEYFFKNINDHLVFMRKFVLINKKNDLTGDALFFAQLAFLFNKLINTTPGSEEANLYRTALLGVDPEIAYSFNPNDSENIAYTFKGALIYLARIFGEDKWNEFKQKGYIFDSFAYFYEETRLDCSVFLNSSYSELYDFTSKLERHNNKRRYNY
jgi:hypothetical protein